MFYLKLKHLKLEPAILAQVRLVYLLKPKSSRPPDPGSFAPEVILFLGCMWGWRPDGTSAPFDPIYLRWHSSPTNHHNPNYAKRGTLQTPYSFVLTNS